MKLVLILVLLSLLYIGHADQGIGGVAKLEDPTEEDNDCLVQLRELFTPEKRFFEELTSIYINSGRSHNNLGNEYACDTGPQGLEYIILQVMLVDSQFIIANQGLCSPKQCNTQEYFKAITDLISNTISKGLKGDKVKSWIVIPSTIDQSISPAAVIMLIVIFSIILLWIAGIVLNYTRIGDTAEVRSGAESHTKIEERKTIWALALISFNPLANLQKLITVKEGGDQTLAALNGVRVLSMGWVIVGHSFAFPLFGAVSNLTTFAKVFNNPSFGVVAGGLYAVDTFFWLSGFLTFALLTTKMYPKKGNIGGLNFIMIYFHRFYRLIIPLAFVQFFMMSLMTYLGDSATYSNSWKVANENCKTWWWSNLLFVNNFLPWKMADQCMGWTWYLANDMQFFIFSPILIFVYCKVRRLTYIICILLIVISMAVNGGLTIVYDISPTLASDKFDAGNWMYQKPWSRMSTYFVGAICGLSYFELSQQDNHMELRYTTFNKIYKHLKSSRLTSFVFFLIGVGLTAAFSLPLGAFYEACGAGSDPAKPANCWKPFPSLIYNLTARPFFIIGVALILFPTFVGRLGFIKSILSAELFTVLARISYLAYLIHPLVIFWNIFDQRQATYFSNLNQWFFAIGTIIVTYLLCIPFTLLCETPFLNLEKWVLFPVRRPKRESVGDYNGLDEFTQKGKFHSLPEDDETTPSLMKHEIN